MKVMIAYGRRTIIRVQHHLPNIRLLWDKQAYTMGAREGHQIFSGHLLLHIISSDVVSYMDK